MTKEKKMKTKALFQNMDNPKSKYLVFTSAGDNSRLADWLEGDRDFDLWISYYGNEQDRYRDISDYYMVKKGGKFPALHYAYQHWKEILDQYQAIIVMDDDIIISATAISELFKIREKYDLWLLQPAFDPQGKISHLITQVNPATFMRYTNFVEVTCPLFRKDKLDKFMKVYDPILVGWGVDLWFIEVLGPDVEGKVAIVDKISCINPHDDTKSDRREIDTLQKKEDRIRSWKKIKEKYHLQNDQGGIVEYGSIVNNLLPKEYISSLHHLSLKNKSKNIEPEKNMYRTMLCDPDMIFKQVIQPKNKAIRDLKKAEKQQQALMDLMREMIKLRLMRHPIKKYKAYKKLVRQYQKNDK